MEQTRRTRQAYYYWLATSTCPDPGCAREGRRSRTGGNQPALPSDLCTLTHLETWSSAGFWIAGENVQILQPGCLVVEHWLCPVESTGVQCTIIVINDRDVWPCPQRYTSHCWLDHFCEQCNTKVTYKSIEVNFILGWMVFAKLPFKDTLADLSNILYECA